MSNAVETRSGEVGDSYIISNYAMAPINMLKAELTGVYGSELLKDLNKIIEYYRVYEMGADFDIDGAKDYTPSNMKFKLAKSLVNKESRFMFSRTPSCYIKTTDKSAKTNETQTFVDEVLKANKFSIKLLKASKDCFIGKRVGIFVDFTKDGILFSFAPSLEFIYETDANDVDKLVKVVRFWTTKDSGSKTEQRIFKKKYWLNNGVCHISEGIYNGIGDPIQIINEDLVTPLPFIPVHIIINDGLSGDPMGESEIETLLEYEKNYNKLANADIDSLRKGMNQVAYTIDASPESTKGLSRSPGSFWDLDTDPTAAEMGRSASVGVLDNSMEYSAALETTLARIKSTMYEQLDIPETNAESLKGVVTSGKTLKALYWGLMTRCEEKMHTWKVALEWLVSTIIYGARVYSEVRKKYKEQGKLLDNFEVEIENNYPLLEDELEEKQSDIIEVNAKVLSKKSYMKKWRELTDEEVDEEIKQIVQENEMESSFSVPLNEFNNEGGQEEEEIETEEE